jgi:hypothetical protein
MRRPRADAQVIYPQGTPSPISQQSRDKWCRGDRGEIIFDRVAGKTRHDDDDHRDKAKVKPDARERVRTELERKGPIQSNDEQAKELQKRVDEMVRQSLARIERYETGTETITTPARTFVEAVGAPPETWAARDVEKEKTTLGARRGSSHDPKSHSSERHNDDGESHSRKSHDRPPRDNRDNGRGEDHKKDYGKCDYGRGDDDDPRRRKDDYKRDVKKEDRKPRTGYPNGGGGGDDSNQPSDDDPKRGKGTSKKDKKEGRTPRKKRPGGGDDGGGDDPSSDGETEDDDFLPNRRRRRRRSPRGTEPGDSETSCASNSENRMLRDKDACNTQIVI